MKKILAALLILVGGQSAFADTCGKSLTGTFTSFQATRLCSVFGSAVNHSLIPSADNTYDLGSSSLGWKTLYADTSVITPLLNATASQVIRVDADAQRLFTFDASSDTALSTTFGDGGTTAAQAYVFSASTADADDDSIFSIAGGGSDAGTRGAYASFAGNENAAGQPGEAIIHAGNVVNGRILMRTTGTQDIDYILNSVQQFKMTSGGSFQRATAALSADVTTIVGGTPMSAWTGDPDSGANVTNVAFGNDASGPLIYSLKTRATDTTADVVVQSGDELLKLRGIGADGAAYRAAASIDMFVDGTPGSSDMPGRIEFRTSPDGSATLGTKWTINNAGTFVSSNITNDIGWSAVNAANQACNTTCTTGCVFGMNTGALGNFVGCADATADTCICAGAS